jgi:hypothetical protein
LPADTHVDAHSNAYIDAHVDAHSDAYIDAHFNAYIGWRRARVKSCLHWLQM